MWNILWDFWDTAHSIYSVFNNHKQSNKCPICAELLWHFQSLVMKLMSCLLWWGLESHGNWFVHTVVISVIMNQNLHLYSSLCYKPWTTFFHTFSWTDSKLRDSITNKNQSFSTSYWFMGLTLCQNYLQFLNVC